MAFKPELTPSGRWRGGFRHPVTGRKIHKTHDYEWEAESWAVTAEQQAREAANLSPESEQCDPPGLARGTGPASMGLQAPSTHSRRAAVGPTLAEYGQTYLERRRGRLSRQTWEKYGALIRGLDVPVAHGAIGARYMGLLTENHVEQWRTDCVDAGIPNPTINARLSIIRRLYANLLKNQRDGLPLPDPTADLDMLPEDEKDDHVVLPAEEQALLTAAEDVGGLAFRTALIAGLDAGLRWQEVYALKPSALFNDGEYLLITNVVERGRDTPRPYTKGKGNTGHRKRTVPTTERLQQLLLELAESRADNELLFPGPKGGLMDYHNHRNRLWLPAMYKIGAAEKREVPTARVRKYGPLKGQPYLQVRYRAEWGFHALRHSYATRLALKGVVRSQLQVLLGHADERTTARYIHSGDDGHRLELVRHALAA